jgi:hypothetical protein
MQITCKEAIRCSRPVYFEVEENFEYSEEYPYYRHGSSFICKYRDRYFIVTAEHVIQDTDNPERLFVLSEKDDETILVPDRSIKINSNDEPFKDIRIFRIDDSIENDEWKVDAIPISERSVHIGSKATQHGSSLVLSGFPKSRQSIDLQNKTLKQERVVIKGFYESNTSKFKHRMKFPSGHGVTTTEGFSGSPVLCESQDGFGISGLTIWGGSDGVQFIDSGVLWRLFEEQSSD